MKHQCLILLFVTLFCSEIVCAKNEKFFSKASEIVWGIENPNFNASIEVPDSLYGNESAVFIAALRSVEVSRESSLNITKYANTGKAYSNAIDCKMIIRMMVKLNDVKAVEEYSEFDFAVKNKESINNYSYQFINSAFGARVHKQDGSVIDVDCSEAYSITAGKKDKEIERKIAIPGLEPGDVLEYFYYDEVWLDELDLEPIEFPFLRKYPAMYYKIECKIDPELTVEYRTYNGAPLLMGSRDKNGFVILKMEAEKLDKKETDRWMAPMRQQPFIKMYVLNNETDIVYRTPSARKGGVWCNLPIVHYYDDIAHMLGDLDLSSKITSKATKTIKNYKENHPKLTSRQLLDVAWLATIYYGLIDKDGHTNIAMSVYFTDVLKKIGYNDSVAIGIVNSRYTVPVNQILHWKEPNYVVMVGDTCYMINKKMCFLPGELAGDYGGEDVVLFYGKRQDFKKNYPVVKKLPTTRPVRNTMRTEINVSFNENEDGILDVKRTVKLDGALKEYGVSLEKNEWIAAVEEYLEIPQRDRYEMEIDSIEYNESLKEKFKEEITVNLGVEPRNVLDFSIKSSGITPDKSSYIYEVDCDVDGLVKRAGNDLVVSIGKLIGDKYEVEGSDRERGCDVVLNSPFQSRYIITLDIPEGYVVNETSLKNIHRNIANKCGAFYVQALIVDGKLELQVHERFLRYVYPLSLWSQYLELIDASSLFNNASIILSRQ